MIGALIAGALTGLLSGFGVGGGTLLMIWLVSFRGVPQTQAQGTNLLYFLPCSAAALVSHVKNGLVDKKIAIPASVAGTLTTLAAAYFATGLDSSMLKRFFGAFLLIVGVIELFKK